MPINILDFIDAGYSALIITLLVGGLISFARGWVIPKVMYDREVKRADDATITVVKVADALKALTDEVRSRREAR